MKGPRIEDVEREHDHQYLTEELDPYVQYDANLISGVHTGDVCPRCGDVIDPKENVVRWDGEEGTVMELTPEDASIPVYHKDCFRERKAEAEGQKKTGLKEDWE